MAEKEMCLYLRGGQTLTVRVQDVRVLRPRFMDDFLRLEWAHVDDATAAQLREVRPSAIDAVTVRDIPDPDLPKEA